MVTLTYVGPLWWQSKQYLLAGSDSSSRSTVRLYSSNFFVPLAISANRVGSLGRKVRYLSRGEWFASAVVVVLREYYQYVSRTRRRPNAADWRTGASGTVKKHMRFAYVIFFERPNCSSTTTAGEDRRKRKILITII